MSNPRRELQRVAESGGAAADCATDALTAGPTRDGLRSAIRALARHRGPARSICPSDAARAVGGDGWRALMEPAREAAAELARGGEVVIRQGGHPLDPEQPWRGPIRISVTEP